MKVAIIGGGIIGLSCAYYLRKKGAEVIIIDKGRPGSACSKGNMGWITPSLSDPVPSPGLVGSSIRWLLQRDSPLYIKPITIPSLISWLYQFWKNCNEACYVRGFEAGLALSKSTLQLFDELEMEEGLSFEMYKQGLLLVFLDEKSLEAKLNTLQIVGKAGLPRPVRLSQDEVLEMEPSLSSQLIGGILLPGERHVRPESLSQGLEHWLTQHGVEIRSHTEVEGFHRREDQLIFVTSGAEHIEADAFILAAGTWSARLGREAGIRIPLTAGKGYSMTISQPETMVSRPLYLGDSRVAISPYDGALRIGGTMEFSGVNEKVDQKRVESILRSAALYFDQEVEVREANLWSGMRPMTPDGLPIIGRMPGFNNLYIATGHAMNGITMCLPTAEAVAELITSGESKVDLTPFSPARFI